jgi:hypothetical protein
MPRSTLSTRLGGASFNSGTLGIGISQYEEKTRRKIAEVMEDIAKEMEEYAQENAPWEDETGDAREGLRAEKAGGSGYFKSNDQSIVLYHTVEYGIWLEVLRNGEYAIILPTIEAFSVEIMTAMENITSEIIYYA